MWFSTDIGFEIDLGCVFASIFRSWGCFWEPLGGFGRPLGLPWATLGAPGDDSGTPWGSPGAPQGGSGEPLGTLLGSLEAPGVDLGGF